MVRFSKMWDFVLVEVFWNVRFCPSWGFSKCEALSLARLSKNCDVLNEAVQNVRFCPWWGFSKCEALSWRGFPKNCDVLNEVVQNVKFCPRWGFQKYEVLYMSKLKFCKIVRFWPRWRFCKLWGCVIGTNVGEVF